jgi:pimeloyl-ACP methyl ester carboxylesterase
LAERFPRLMDLSGKFLMAQPAAYDLARLLKMIDPERCSRRDLRDYLHHLTEIGFPFFFRMLRELGEHSAEDLLPEVRCPALIIAGEFDAFTPHWLAERLDELLPDSELKMLAGASHAGIIEQPSAINEAIADFLRRRVSAAGS